jgi:hypothetical protein
VNKIASAVLAVSAVLAALQAAPSNAASPESKELLTRWEKYHVEYRLNADATHVETRRQEVRIQDEKALAWAKRSSVGFSTSTQKAEILEAYTRKPDGRRIEAPKNNYQLDVASGREKDAPAFSDRSSLGVVFPEAAVGDVLVFAYRITQLDPIFPGHFSVIESFPKLYAYDDVRVRFDAPAGLALRFEANDMKPVEPVQGDGRIVREWTFAHPAPLRSERRDFSVHEPDSEPSVIASTFASHEDIARAYGARAEPKAAVTERVRKLADEIAGDRKGVREQVHVLYDWVATKITYAGNCVGIGAVVPRDIDFVLDNRMGDCKDHATLLQALLAARGIRSTQALVNAGASYRLPRIPVVSMVNHVISYVPELDLYLDSTSDSTPFGMLPFASADKPVLLADGSKLGSRTPALKPGINEQRVKTVVHVQPDGSAKGTIEVTQKGMFAATSRSRFRELTREMEDELMKSAFRTATAPGLGKLEKEDPKPLLDTYRYSVAFEMQEFVRLPGAGAFTVQPLFYSDSPIQGMIATAQEPREDVLVSCSNGRSDEEYVIHLPANLRILEVPNGMTIEDKVATYKSSYALKGRTLSVKRSLDDRTPGNVCTPATMDAFRGVAKKAMKDLSRQLVYR